MGSIGRYMEELEYSDGFADFGSISRSKDAVRRRKREEPKFEYIDWGAEGAVYHIPFTSLLFPILSIPDTIHRVFTPPLNFLSLYRESFDSGMQKRFWTRFREEIERGGAGDVILKASKALDDKVQEKEKKRQELNEIRKDLEKFKHDNSNANGGSNTGNGNGTAPHKPALGGEEKSSPEHRE